MLRAEDRAAALHGGPGLVATEATEAADLRARWEVLRAEIDPEDVTGHEYEFDAVVRRWREERDGLRRVD